jgi:ribonuclease VapC
VILDSSAIIAIVCKEPESSEFVKIIESTDDVRMSVATWLETCIVVDSKRDPIASRVLDEVKALIDIELVPVTAEQVEIARAAFRDFGKGSGHPAGLNFGDCFSYALAKYMREPLLFKGRDFVETDLISAQ